jgi:glyceraldehyde-3-phosphate dehydrogenase (NADP+)
MMKKPHAFLIQGKWRRSSEVLDVRNPYNGETVAQVCRPGIEDVEEAIRAMVRVFEKTGRLATHSRVTALQRAAALVQERREEIARTLCLESGKPIRSSRGEVDRAVCTLTLASHEAGRIYGEILPLDITRSAEGRLGLVRRFPIGPLAGITPFNFPLNLVCHKVAPALAVGNPITIKPSSATPLTALKLGEILVEAGVLPGAVNILPVHSKLADALVTDERIRMISFTGSAEVGWNLKTRAGKKRVCLELGGNAAVVVEPDADLKYAVERSVLGGYAYAGQICIAVQRIFVHQKIFDEFMHAYVQGAKALKVGDPMDEDTDVGPMIDEGAAAQTEEWVREAEDGGGKILTGGQREGTLFQPTVLTGVRPEARVCAQEVFAPVVVVEPYASFEEAIDRVNDSRYGLQAGVFTRDVEKIFVAYNRMEVGGVMANDIPTFRVDHMPYGGVKDSGFGREGVRYAVEEMTELKLLMIDRGLSHQSPDG